MPAAYAKASANGTLPAHARQIMYAARGEIQRLTGRMLDDQYFTQQLLPDFMNEHPGATAEWDVVFDARGHFHEPHTGRIVPLGTIEVRRHLRAVAAHTLPELQVDLPGLEIFPTCGPDHRYGAILFIEKEGFLPLFKAVRLAERFDLAIMSTKGLSVTASRLLVDRLCAAHAVPLLVLHDFDKSGFSILGTLRRDTRRYAFRNRIAVVDLGLRLEDVEDSGLETEDVVHRSDPVAPAREWRHRRGDRVPAHAKGRTERLCQRRLCRLDRTQARAARCGQGRARSPHADAGLPPKCCFSLRRFATPEHD
jgi:Topoisomerase 6 subunit A/Spo11, Toprim domain